MGAGGIINEDQSFADAREAIFKWHGAADGRLQVWYGPQVPRAPATTCSPEFYARVAHQAAEYATGITIHLGAEADDIPFFEQTFHLKPVEFALMYGMVGSNVLLINGCWFTDDEIRILAETDTRLVHSPSANMKMASGVAKVTRMREAGVTVALGCDSGANNNCHDMIREMKAASLLQKISGMDAHAMPAEAVLEMATINGARAIGRQTTLGSIEPGKQADLILVNMRQPHTQPEYDPIANLVYCAHGGDVDTVLVAGRILMRNRKMIHVDEREILDEAQTRGQALLDSAGIRVTSNWPIE
jgi:5-methylthioadenosine/S-adenosylhomocysteine deaminase